MEYPGGFKDTFLRTKEKYKNISNNLDILQEAIQSIEIKEQTLKKKQPKHILFNDALADLEFQKAMNVEKHVFLIKLRDGCVLKYYQDLRRLHGQTLSLLRQIESLHLENTNREFLGESLNTSSGCNSGFGDDDPTSNLDENDNEHTVFEVSLQSPSKSQSQKTDNESQKLNSRRPSTSASTISTTTTEEIITFRSIYHWMSTIFDHLHLIQSSLEGYLETIHVAQNDLEEGYEIGSYHIRLVQQYQTLDIQYKSLIQITSQVLFYHLRRAIQLDLDVQYFLESNYRSRRSKEEHQLSRTTTEHTILKVKSSENGHMVPNTNSNDSSSNSNSISNSGNHSSNETSGRSSDLSLSISSSGIINGERQEEHGKIREREREGEGDRSEEWLASRGGDNAEVLGRQSDVLSMASHEVTRDVQHDERIVCSSSNSDLYDHGNSELRPISISGGLEERSSDIYGSIEPYIGICDDSISIPKSPRTTGTTPISNHFLGEIPQLIESRVGETPQRPPTLSGIDEEGSGGIRSSSGDESPNSRIYRESVQSRIQRYEDRQTGNLRND
jgi:hypothetical protein